MAGTIAKYICATAGWVLALTMTALAILEPHGKLTFLAIELVSTGIATAATICIAVHYYITHHALEAKELGKAIGEAMVREVPRIH